MCYLKAEHDSLVPLWDIEWFRDRCEESPVRLLAVWNVEAGNWVRQTAKDICLYVEATIPTVLVKNATVAHCAGLGEELTLLEQASGREDSSIRRTTRLHNHSIEEARKFRIIAWGLNEEGPYNFVVSMSDVNTLRLADYRPILKYVHGASLEEDADDPNNQTYNLEIWDASQGLWVLKRTTDVIGIRPADELLLVRSPAVPQGNGMGERIAKTYEASFMQWAADLQDLRPIQFALPRSTRDSTYTRRFIPLF
ncbi:hypothetical protein C8Q76DRAFT_698384 [Earliella scabrosa]|nr:hypothetical protein C8Q76DRAFT_698384 [Earliella scabrosa]